MQNHIVYIEEYDMMQNELSMLKFAEVSDPNTPPLQTKLLLANSFDIPPSFNVINNADCINVITINHQQEGC